VHDFPVTLVGVVDPAQAGTNFCGVTVRGTLADFGDVDAVIVTGVKDAETIFRAMRNEIGEEHVLVPMLLGLRVAPADAPAAEIRAAE
jgi:hypothetical protein